MEKVAEPSWTSSYTYQVSKHSAEMLHNLNVQRKDGGRFCDVILRVGEDSFPAHKAVLAACSEYFESVFSRQSEGEAKELEMHTISPKVFKDILDFAYTSRIVVRLECFPELMTAAKFLLMRSVIEICQEVIKQSNVQILVPTSRGGEASLFQAAAAGAAELGFPVLQQDLLNGTGVLVNGQTFPNHAQIHVDHGERTSAELLEEGGESSVPVLEPVEGLPVSPSVDLTGNTFNHDAASPASKRGRGRPKKATVEAVLHFNHCTTTTTQKDTVLFPCGTCGKAFTEASRLKNHEAQHGASSCGGLAAAGTLSLLNHPQAVLMENGVQLHAGLTVDSSRKRERTRRHVGCDICGKVFRDVYHLNRHKLSHSGEKPYACHVCGLRFKRKDRMSYHVRSHDGSVGKPYVCQSCGKGFSRPDHLNGHIKQVHTTERPHKCQICSASFATRDRLRSHLACHEDKVPCKVCGKFLRAAYMTDHLKKHSEGTHNYCGVCNKGFSTASYLKVHIKTHHGSSLSLSAQMHTFPESRGELQIHNGTPYHMGHQCSVEDVGVSRQLLLTSSEAECRFHGLSGHPVLPQPGPPALGLQPELLLGKSGEAPYFWECRSGGVPAFPVHGPAADGQENAGKCLHLESEESDPSFGELPDGDELKSPHKPDGPELEVASLACNGQAAGALGSSEGAKPKTDPEKKFICSICGQAFRTKSYLNKHQHRVHKTQRGQVSVGAGLSELPPSLTSPFSPQQSMSLLESFGFQIVQSAFASSLVDTDAGQSGVDFGGK
ncbi:POZ-, AT hook-, and zinc finger-containing protein 1 isoform X1 [Thalassophryne amazonica]|uniref:POZ-, AT hook-, and zinc finger-containing protein 1 isoform X1 n=1 Tax=Thalassophryne amazonica TaxID=390379 RepID=UPI001471CF47|nr:POZ-, AT hook-, and zinc finger-containing protein 1 isoform X1 [Thalassophryne amazonica]